MKKAKGHRRNLNSDQEQREQAKSRFKIVFLGVGRDTSGRIGFFGSSGGASGFGLQIGTVPTRSGRLESMYKTGGLYMIYRVTELLKIHAKFSGVSVELFI